MRWGRKIRSILEGVARLCVVAAVVVSPWLFGAFEAWAYLLVCLVVAVGTGCWLLTLALNGRARLRAPLVAGALVLFIALIIVQVFPLPIATVERLNPSAAAAQADQQRLFADMGMREFLPWANSADGTATLSAAPAATRQALYLMIAYSGVFLVLAHTVRKWAHVRLVLMTLAVSGFVMAILGMVHRFSGGGPVLWFRQTRYGGAVFGPFANRNHYAAYMCMVFGATLALAFSELRETRFWTVEGWRKKVAWLSSGKANLVAFLLFAAAIVGASVWVSLSRGGAVSMLVAIGLVAVALSFTKDAGRLRAAVSGSLLLALALVVWISWQPVADRMGTLFDLDVGRDGRTVATLSTYRMFQSAPVWGYGYGAYEHAFPMYQVPEIQPGRWLHAHNDPVQWLAEGGLIGAFLSALMVAAFVAHLYWARHRVSPRAAALIAGSCVGIVAVFLHSVVDFVFRSPAIAATMAALAGLCAAAPSLPHSRRYRRQTSSREKASASDRDTETDDTQLARIES